MPTRRNSGKSLFTVWVLAFLCTVSVLAFTRGYVYAWTCIGTAAQCQKYQEACESAAGELTADKVYDGLTPISADNPNLIWKDGVVGSKVLVAAYKWGTWKIHLFPRVSRVWTSRKTARFREAHGSRRYRNCSISLRPPLSVH